MLGCSWVCSYRDRSSIGINTPEVSRAGLPTASEDLVVSFAVRPTCVWYRVPEAFAKAWVCCSQDPRRSWCAGAEQDRVSAACQAALPVTAVVILCLGSVLAPSVFIGCHATKAIFQQSLKARFHMELNCDSALQRQMESPWAYGAWLWGHGCCGAGWPSTALLGGGSLFEEGLWGSCRAGRIYVNRYTFWLKNPSCQMLSSSQALACVYLHGCIVWWSGSPDWRVLAWFFFSLLLCKSPDMLYFCRLVSL